MTLYQDDVSASGWFKKHSNNTPGKWNKRFLVVRGAHLSFGESESIQAKHFTIAGVAEHEKNQKEFLINTHQGPSFRFRAEYDTPRDDFLKKLKAAKLATCDSLGTGFDQLPENNLVRGSVADVQPVEVRLGGGSGAGSAAASAIMAGKTPGSPTSNSSPTTAENANENTETKEEEPAKTENAEATE